MESQSEINRKARDLKNTQQLQLCYNAIVRADIFEYIQEPDEISGCNYIRMLNDWKKNRNETVLNNQLLNSVKGWLIPFNNRMTDLMFWYVSSFNKIIKWKNKKEDVSFNGFEIQLNKRLEFFNQIPTCIRLNYDKDKYLAFEIQEYCLNGFKQMITYTKDNLMIDIEQTPYFTQIQNIINQIQNEIELEKLSLSLNHKPKENHIEEKSKKSSYKQLTEYFNNLTNVNDFLIELTQTFTTEKGKSIKFIIDELIKEELLVIPDRQMKNFIDVLQNEFSQNIGNISGINRKFNYDTLFSTPILTKLNPLIIKHKTTT